MADDGAAAPSPSTAMVRHIRMQADACRDLGSPLYAVLLQRLADDVGAGGPAADVLAGHEQDPGPSALALRLMGGVHRLVLEGRAAGLGRHYPSVGGDADPAAAWPELRGVLADHRPELRRYLERPPQTNEVGRAAALVGALFRLVAVRPGPVRLFEIGASAGLNLRADRFRIELADGRGVGPVDSPVVLRNAWEGTLPDLAGVLHVVEREGCDPAPLDPTTTGGRLRLTSYVWPDQEERLARLRGALALAARVPADVRQETARDFVRRIELVPGTTTVLWHSVMWQYLSRDERAEVAERLAELGASAGPAAALAHVALEPGRTPDDDWEFQVRMQVWPGDGERVVGTASPHGIPTVWRPDPP